MIGIVDNARAEVSYRTVRQRHYASADAKPRIGNEVRRHIIKGISTRSRFHWPERESGQ